VTESPRHDDFAELAARYLDDRLDAAGLHSFGEQMRQPANQALFLEVCMQSRLLGEVLNVELDAEVLPFEPLTRRSGWWIGGVAAAAIVMLIATLWLVFMPSEPDQRMHAGSSRGMALLTNSVNARWRDGMVPTLGGELRAGVMDLHHGRAQIMMHSGAVVEMYAPCRFELTGENRGILHEGRLTAHVPERARGFTVEATSMRVVDLGTEFGMLVGAARPAQVHVFEGMVRVDLLDGSGAVRESAMLLAQQAVRLGGHGQSVEPIAAARWRFAEISERAQTTPMQAPGLGTVTVVKAQAPTTDTPLADGYNTFPTAGDHRFVLPANAPPFETAAQWNHRTNFLSLPGMTRGALHGWDESGGELMSLTTHHEVAPGRYEVFVVYACSTDLSIADPGGIRAALYGQPLAAFDSRNGVPLVPDKGWPILLGRLGVVEGDDLVIDVARSQAGQGHRTVYFGLAFRPVGSDLNQTLHR
jgi:ferric-dicitrate binding protein FerR (iron transport regulator)